MACAQDISAKRRWFETAFKRSVKPKILDLHNKISTQLGVQEPTAPVPDVVEVVDVEYQNPWESAAARIEAQYHRPGNPSGRIPGENRKKTAIDARTKANITSFFIHPLKLDDFIK